MSKYLGDFSASTVIDFKFTTFRPSTGAPFTLAGSPVVSVYKDDSTTQSTAGVTLTVDFDSVTGLHHVRITTATDGTFYANGGEFECVITAGTVDSVSVAGSCIGRFTLRSQASLYPTTSGNTLDVNANGEAGIDWANVGNPTTTLGLSGTTIANVTVGSISAGAITAASIATNAITSAKIADASLTAAKFGDSALVIGSAAAGGVKAYLNAGSITAGVIATNAIDADALATDAVTEIADGILARDIGSGSNALTTLNERTVRSALRALRNKSAIVGSTLTVCKEDDDTDTPAWTAAVSSSASADPVTGIDPAGP